MSTALLLMSHPEIQTNSLNQGAPQISLMTKNVSINNEIQALTSSTGQTPSGELVYVYIYVKPGYSTHIIDPYVYEVPNRDEENNFAVAWVDTNKLDTVAAVEGVRLIREVIPPGVNIGSVTTQGDTVLNTANVRTLYGYSGSGMKIGVISNGVDHLSESVATGDLPNNVHVLSNTIGGDEGTAMLEIIHDMVPNATLYFHDEGSNTAAFDAAVDDLISNGCTVICDDVYWKGEPFFEDGPVASHIESALSEYPIVYLSAAGNEADGGYNPGHYQGTFFNSGVCENGGCWNDFSGGTAASIDDEEMYVDLPPGSSVEVVLEWNDKFGQSGNNYDLYLWDYPSGTRLAYSIDTQSGTGDPLEYIPYTNTGSTTITGEITVWKSNTAAVKTLGVYIYPHNGASVYTGNLVAAGSIYGQTAAPDVVSVAAMDYSTPSTIEPFSSLGPVTITYPSPVTRVKPDISGVDGVSVSSAASDLNPFFGTSAATPGIAAIVAQIWGAHPYLTPAQVRNALYTSAVDLGDPGKDTTFGYGRADALATAIATYIPPPTVTSILPTAGPIAGGSVVTITGTSLTGATAVSFGTTAATLFTVVNVTAVTATTPAHAAGTVDVTVTTLGGTSAKSSSDQYSFAAVPTVIGISPAAGPIAGGSNITITGTSFNRTTAVTFGTTAATLFTVVNATMITATAPAVTAGTVDVTVTTPGGISAKSSADKYTYAAVPTVTGISPAAGPLTGGSVVTITGTAFTGASWVTFGSTAATHVTVVNATAVTATVPANTTAGTVDVTVTTPGGTSAVVPADQFTYQAPPTVTGISPAAGPIAGGTVVTVTGTVLTGANAVTFGSTADSHITFVNTTMVTATAPAHAAGTVDITVTTPGGTSAKSSADQYTYVAPPAVTTVAPATPWYRNATVPFLLTGTNFAPGQTTVTFSYPSNGTALNPDGFTVNTVTATTINGSVVVPLNAPTGTWNVSVTTLYGGQVWKAAAFTVSNFPAPTITSVTYPPGNIGTTVLFTITGTNFQTDSTKTSVTIYNDVTNTVLPTTVLSTMPTTIIGSATISSSVPAGSYNVNVTTVDGGIASRPGSFAVGFVGIPTITSLTPVSGFLNATVNFTVTGTNFEPGSTVVAFTNQTTSQTLTHIFYNVTSPTQISGNVSIPYNALSGPYRLDITTTDGGVVNKPNAFTANVFPAPTITSLTPITPWYRNATVPFLITGTNFKSGQTTVAFNYPSNGTTLNSTVAVNAVSATTISGTVVVPYFAPTGTWNVSVATIDGGTVWKPAAITVNQFPASAITSITPATGTKNSTVLFTLAGTNFEPVGTSVTIVEDTSGTVLNATLISVTPTTIVGNFTIPGSVPAGLYRLQVTTVDGGTVSKLQAFTINYLPLPVMTSLIPATGYRNTTVSFTLTGNYFLNGGTTVMLRTVGTTLPASMTFVNTTTIQGSFTIPFDAPTGSYTLYVITTGGGFNSKPNAFKVT
jgi:hypothetical protein